MEATLTQLFELCLQYRASDLHLSPNTTPRLRVNGDLIVLDDFPVLTAQTIKTWLNHLLDHDQQKTLEMTGELDVRIADFRANIFKQALGVSAAFRVIPATIPTWQELGLPPIIQQLSALSSGLVLVVGLTGSGKTTTLAAMVDDINTQAARHVLTIEDPIEFMHISKKSLISQRQVFRDTHDFNSALRAALREDPDVILLGEMRDLETIRLALTAAETGHLVMATLHASSAARAISRMVDVFPDQEKNRIRYQLADALQGVIFQSLHKNKLGGRAAAFEIMLGTSAIRNLIREDKIAQINTIIQTNGHLGMCTLAQSLQELVRREIIDSL